MIPRKGKFWYITIRCSCNIKRDTHTLNEQVFWRMLKWPIKLITAQIFLIFFNVETSNVRHNKNPLKISTSGGFCLNTYQTCSPALQTIDYSFSYIQIYLARKGKFGIRQFFWQYLNETCSHAFFTTMKAIKQSYQVIQFNRPCTIYNFDSSLNIALKSFAINQHNCIL